MYSQEYQPRFYSRDLNALDEHEKNFVPYRFVLSDQTKSDVYSMTPEFGFGELGPATYFRTYSRKIDKPERKQENWGDTIIRCIEGALSFRKSHMIKNHLAWNDEKWQKIGRKMALTAYKFNWLPPGRGLWACGTDYCYEEGSAALNNCSNTSLKNLPFDTVWLADMLMCGCGVGFKLDFDNEVFKPAVDPVTYVVPDCREGWAHSIGLLVNAYVPNEDGYLCPPPIFDYSQIRPAGAPLKRFGGVCSGYKPLEKLHKRIRTYFETYLMFNETSEPNYEAFNYLIDNLRDEDWGYMDDFDFNNLKKHVLGQIVIGDLLTLARYFQHKLNCYNADDFNLIENATDDYQRLRLMIICLNDPERVSEFVKNNREKVSEFVKNDRYVNFYQGLFGFFTVSEELLRLLYHCFLKMREKERQAYEPILKSKVYNKTRLTIDIQNAIGACVVAGNVRRSSQIAGGSPDDMIFLELKNDWLNPERMPISYMSNNSCIFDKTEQFPLLKNIAKRVVEKGEPGFFNAINVRRYGRVGRRLPNPDEKWSREYEEDPAIFINPCGEIPLADKELCNLSELFPTRCLENGEFNEELFYEVVEYATIYASSVSLLPTHWECTNAIIARNRRIGVSISGGAQLYDMIGIAEMTRVLREAYKIVRRVNNELAMQAGVPASIRVTTVKPGGTVPLLAGVSSGMHFPHFKYAIRRIRVGIDSPIVKFLVDAGYPYEKDVRSDNTYVFEFFCDLGKTRAAEEVSIWEKVDIQQLFQREWSDNAVSVTHDFDPETEAHQLERVLAAAAPMIKACSLLPRLAQGSYEQMPYEGITEEQFQEKIKNIQPIDWSQYGIAEQSDGICPKYCNNDYCSM